MGVMRQGRMGEGKERGRVGLAAHVACAMEECLVRSRLTCKRGIRGHRGVMILGGRASDEMVGYRMEILTHQHQGGYL